MRLLKLLGVSKMTHFLKNHKISIKYSFYSVVVKGPITLLEPKLRGVEKNSKTAARECSIS